MAAAELAIVMKATQAAVRAVETAELIRQHTGLKDIEPSMIEALAIAAEVLLVVELSMPSSMAFPETRRANTMAHQLLEYLAIRGHAAARGCLHSLEVSKVVVAKSRHRLTMSTSLCMLGQLLSLDNGLDGGD